MSERGRHEQGDKLLCSHAVYAINAKVHMIDKYHIIGKVVEGIAQMFSNNDRE